MTDGPDVVVATGGDAPSVDEQAAGQASAAAGAAAVLASQTEQAAAQATEAATVAATSAAEAEGAGEAASAAQAAAAEAVAARDETRAMFANQEAFYERMLARLDTPAPAEPAMPEADQPERTPDRPPARKTHWINKPIGRKRVG